MKLTNIVQNLHWGQPEIAQEDAINKAVEAIKNGELSFPFLFHAIQKPMWENYCKVVDAVGFPDNKEAVTSLFFLLQDINWPGARHAIDMLSGMDRQYILCRIEETVKQAYDENDEMWLGGLNSLIERMGFQESDFETKDIAKKLEKADF